MMTTFLLGITAALVAAAIVLVVQSFRRRDSTRGLLAMTMTMIAALPAGAYGVIT